MRMPVSMTYACTPAAEPAVYELSSGRLGWSIRSRPHDAGVDATGAPTYKLATSGGQLISKSFQKVVTTADVWRMQLGVRYLLNW